MQACTVLIAGDEGVPSWARPSAPWIFCKSTRYSPACSCRREEGTKRGRQLTEEINAAYVEEDKACVVEGVEAFPLGLFLILSF